MDIIALKLESIEASLAELSKQMDNFNKRLIKLEVSKTEQEPIPDNGLSFPAATICSLNYFNAASNLELHTELADYIKSSFPFYFQDSSTDMLGLDSFFQYGFSGYRSVTSSFESNETDSFESNETDSFYYRIKEMLLSCTFSVSECYPTDFAEVFSDDYGKCFTFNSHGSERIYKEGNKYGLDVRIGRKYAND